GVGQIEVVRQGRGKLIRVTDGGRRGLGGTRWARFTPPRRKLPSAKRNISLLPGFMQRRLPGVFHTGGESVHVCPPLAGGGTQTPPSATQVCRCPPRQPQPPQRSFIRVRRNPQVAERWNPRPSRN